MALGTNLWTDLLITPIYPIYQIIIYPHFIPTDRENKIWCELRFNRIVDFVETSSFTQFHKNRIFRSIFTFLKFLFCTRKWEANLKLILINPYFLQGIHRKSKEKRSFPMSQDECKNELWYSILKSNFRWVYLLLVACKS